MPLKSYPDHEFLPRELTPEEINDPTLVINDFFDYMHLPQHRKVNRQLVEVLVTGSFNLLSQQEKIDLLHQFQWLEKSVEAIHIIHTTFPLHARANK